MAWSVGVLLMSGKLNPLHRIQVVEIAPEFLKAVSRRQSLHVVAQVVLTELPGGVTEIAQEHCERWSAGTQVARTTRQLRRNHASAKRMHAGKESIAPGGATLLGIISHEDRTFVADAIDVRRFSYHQTSMVDTRLHPADIVAHYENDVGFFLLPERRPGCCG